ncbi:hypothetical protein BGW38_007289 [Lunasporangiospora selenospora]|uniref:H/ACA ribonucleoprotein complex non-core subunit NAF1 n=1 Tax=Lunasporangiospora selenospora TaxID=979761 RepID=A0A9P6FYF9_9FUNG|nr:hypothetical protein BGW38_007289 [Lunasporangiospora selenospora]
MINISHQEVEEEMTMESGVAPLCTASKPSDSQDLAPTTTPQLTSVTTSMDVDERDDIAPLPAGPIDLNVQQHPTPEVSMDTTSEMPMLPSEASLSHHTIVSSEEGASSTSAAVFTHDAVAAATAAGIITENIDISSGVKHETTSITISTADDRIDAILAGEDSKDGYESSDLESSSDDSGDSSSDDSNSDADDSNDHDDSDSETELDRTMRTALTLEQREKVLMAIDAMDGDSDMASGGALHTANEITQLPEVKKPEITLTPETHLDPVGAVQSIVENVVVVESFGSGDVQVLDSGTIVAVIRKGEDGSADEREVLGEIFETFGPVKQPMYSIRFNKASDIPAGCIRGSTVYAVPEHSSVVLTAPLKAMKGCDASNRYDEEVDEGEMEFSDDEKEMEYKRMKVQKQKKKGGRERKLPQENSAGSSMDTTTRPIAAPVAPTSRPRFALPPKPTFDANDDGYRILQRPGALTSTPNRPPGAPASASAAVGSVPWYMQQQRELQNMQQQQQQQFEQQQRLHQQLLLQQQQQKLLYDQQQQQQALYQKQIQEAQETIMRLQQQLQSSSNDGANASPQVPQSQPQPPPPPPGAF